MYPPASGENISRPRPCPTIVKFELETKVKIFKTRLHSSNFSDLTISWTINSNGFLVKLKKKKKKVFLV